MSITVGPLRDEDAEAFRQLRHEGFGTRISGPAPRIPRRGQNWLAAYDDARLIGRIGEREYEAWFGGARIPTSGLIGGTTEHEYRGGGLLHELMRQIIDVGVQRGAVLSNMFPTAMGIYRRYGFERITDKVTVKITMPALASIRKQPHIRLRRATFDDYELVRGLYDDWAATVNGPLVRRGELFTDSGERWIGSFTGVTIAEDDDGPCGYCAWDRGSGHDEDSYLAITDLIGLRPGATAALLHMFASNAPVAGFVKLDTSEPEPARYAIGTNGWSYLERDTHGLKLYDIPRAFELRTWAPELDVALPFRVEGDILTGNNGSYVLEVRDGRAHVEKGGERPDAVVFTSGGLAARYAGNVSQATLRSLGLIAGDAGRDKAWDSALGGWEAHIRDYF